MALQALLPLELDLGVTPADLAELSASARGTRYVTDTDGAEDPTWAEAERAVVVAGLTWRAVRAHLDHAE